MKIIDYTEEGVIAEDGKSIKLSGIQLTVLKESKLDIPEDADISEFISNQALEINEYNQKRIALKLAVSKPRSTVVVHLKKLV